MFSSPIATRTALKRTTLRPSWKRGKFMFSLTEAVVFVASIITIYWLAKMFLGGLLSVLAVPAPDDVVLNVKGESR